MGISAEELHFPRCIPLFDITEMAARAGAFNLARLFAGSPAIYITESMH